MSARLKPEVKAAWLAALRSGTYAQGSGWLRTITDEYCCLGVRCELAREAGVISSRAYIAAYMFGYPVDDPGGYDVFNDTMPVDKEREWAWVDYEGNEDDIHNAEVKLAEMNDNGVSFREIARHIEENF